jgi:fucose 4-O-acetylase-like acetyltransferase
MSEKHSLAYLDVAKALAIVAVVWGHIASPAGNFLFAWHMPFFFLVGGIFLKPSTETASFARTNIQRLGYPYLVFGLIGIATELVKRIALDRPLGDIADYLTGLLFWMDYSHLTGYHHVLWFLPALLLARLLAFLVAKHIRQMWAAGIVVLTTGSAGLWLPLQLPFALNQALIALPWVWLGYLCFNHPAIRFADHQTRYFLVAGVAVSIYATSGIPSLNLAVNELTSPVDNYVFSTSFSLLLISACALVPALSGSTWVRLWGENTMLIMIAHPYTNNIAYLVVEKWLGGLWYCKLAISLLLLHGLLQVKLQFPRVFPLRYT